MRKNSIGSVVIKILSYRQKALLLYIIGYNRINMIRNAVTNHELKKFWSYFSQDIHDPNNVSSTIKYWKSYK